MKNRYNLYSSSPTETDEFGNPYPDVMFFPIDEFEYTIRPKEITLTQMYIRRIDLLMYDAYGVAYYDDLVLWINDIPSIYDLTPGDKLLLPAKQDLDRFFTRYNKRKKNS